MAVKVSEQAAEEDPLWYKDGVIYQLHIKAFFDSSGDGIGDFAGLTQKLDYLQDLGVTALWLLPFYPSPLKDDGYDIASYTAINENYGTLNDFKVFLREAKRRGLKVITELVVNHTSDQHPWFQKAREAKPGSSLRDFYVWSDNPEKYKEVRIIFKDFEPSNWTWDPVAKSYYWHRFFHHQPDLNFDNPAVHKALFQALDFWMELGVDGLRLDAVPYLYEREGTSCENLPETHEFLKKLRKHIDGNFTNRMLLAEANQWPEDVRPYFGDGDECHVAFHFPLMPRLFMALAMEDRFPIIDILDQTPEIPENSQWALFLRNHDELTLEMVTDEDRDYMYRTYAQDSQARINLGIRRRLAPLLRNHRRRIELMNALLFSFPGTPIIYYGDEIGMGDNIYLGDRHGVRTPMQWSSDRNAGFSRANPQRMYLPVIIDPEYHYEAVNVEAQQHNTESLLWFTKRLIDQRKRTKTFGRGTIEFLQPDNRKVLTFIRQYEDETILVVANLSRFIQGVSIDLSKFAGAIPVEMFGHAEFPEITQQPFFITIAAHGFYWLVLKDKPALPVATEAVAFEVPTLRDVSAENLLREPARSQLEDVLISYLPLQRWFGSKSRSISKVSIEDAIELPGRSGWLSAVRVDYRDGSSEIYSLPLAIRLDTEAVTGPPDGTIARIEGKQQSGYIYEGQQDPEFARALLALVNGRRGLRGEAGEATPLRTRFLKERRSLGELQPRRLKTEQTNTSILFGDQFFMKVFRRLEEGTNTDLEISRFLMEETEFRNTPALAGALEYKRDNGESITLAILQEFVPNGGDAWSFSLDAVGRYFDRIAVEPYTPVQLREVLPKVSLVALAAQPINAIAAATLETFVSSAELIGQRTAEMHLALASRPDIADFAPVPFNPFWQKSLYQTMRAQTTSSLQLLKKKLKDIDAGVRPEAEEVLARTAEIHARFQRSTAIPIEAQRIRTHGDYHLGQVLNTGKDFVIVDFEGEPTRPISERKIKRSALKDVAGMIRSFHYAPYAVLFGQAPGASVRSRDVEALDDAARVWQTWSSAMFLRSYLGTARKGSFLPDDQEQLRTLLDIYLLEKALYELAYELDNRPAWVAIPIRGILQLLAANV